MTDAKEKGERSEQVASWYFRLNGFMTIPGFVVHPDLREWETPQRTEADIIGVRLPFSCEYANKEMSDDKNILNVYRGKTLRSLFIISEVKSGKCQINGAWSERERKNMQRVISRIGFVKKTDLNIVSDKIYDEGRYEDENTVLQYICIGNEVNSEVSQTMPSVVQITFNQISDFFVDRFSNHPPKLPMSGRSVHEQWPDFGRHYGEWFRKNILDVKCNRNNTDDKKSKSNIAIKTYINTGSFYR